MALNSDPKKGAWKCARKICLEREHERIMNARGTGKMCMEGTRGREHGRSVRKRCAERAIK